MKGVASTTNHPGVFDTVNGVDVTLRAVACGRMTVHDAHQRIMAIIAKDFETARAIWDRVNARLVTSKASDPCQDGTCPQCFPPDELTPEFPKLDGG
jgi:hypothetical protein